MIYRRVGVITIADFYQNPVDKQTGHGCQLAHLTNEGIPKKSLEITILNVLVYWSTHSELFNVGPELRILLH